MKKFFPAILATAFATSSALAIFASAAQQPQFSGRVALLGASAQAAFADDRDDNHGNDQGENRDNRGASQDCVNPAGHEKGWCKHGDNEDNQGDEGNHNRKHGKHHNGSGSAGLNRISGTVTAVNGNSATVRLDNGQYVQVQENGTWLNVGQHYNLNGCYQNSVFVLGCNTNNNYPNNNYPGGNNQQISGTVLSVSGNTLTLVGIPPVKVDISRAISNGQVSGQLTPFRHVTIYGYYQNGAFYATSVR